jgi:hypothetical protein
MDLLEILEEMVEMVAKGEKVPSFIIYFWKIII